MDSITFPKSVFLIASNFVRDGLLLERMVIPHNGVVYTITNYHDHVRIDLKNFRPEGL